MTVISYIQEKLSVLAEKFPNVTIKYKYDKEIYRHIIELTPEEIYYNSSELDDEWIPISIEFMEMFPDECISFISDDSTLKIDEPELIFNKKSIEIFEIDTFFGEIMNTEICVGFDSNFSINISLIQSTLTVHNLTELSSISISNNTIINQFLLPTFFSGAPIDIESNSSIPQAA